MNAWDMLALTLLLEVAKLKDDQVIVAQINDKVRTCYEKGPKPIDNCFIPLFFNFDEVVMKIIHESVDYR